MYDVKADQVGWTVYDAETGRPAMLDGLALVELDHASADEMASLLNRNVYGPRRGSQSPWPLFPSTARRDAGRVLSRR